eukprot:362177-Chlamydomonas_euryale.AAC.2
MCACAGVCIRAAGRMHAHVGACGHMRGPKRAAHRRPWHVPLVSRPVRTSCPGRQRTPRSSASSAPARGEHGPRPKRDIGRETTTGSLGVQKECRNENKTSKLCNRIVSGSFDRKDSQRARNPRP